MGGAGGILGGGGVAQQFLLWGVVSQLASGILAPIVTAVQQQVYSGLTTVALTPAQVADLVLKGWWDMERGTAEANKYGISSDRFQAMVDDAGEPPALQMLLQAYRRQVIGWDSDNIDGTSVLAGIKQSRLRDQWADMVKALVVEIIPVGDAVSAAVRGQIPYAQAEQIAYYSGISSDDFRILVNTAGNPPGPGELITLTRRGLIPVDGVGPDVLSLQQGIYEGDTKDKWYPLYVKLMEYLPPPRTITALERAGVITPAQATALYQQQGLTAELAAAYSADASHTKLASTKTLAEGTVLNLYRGGVIPESEAAALLGALNYTPQESAWILAWTDLHRELAALNSAVTKVSGLYIARKIGATTAIAALGTLGLPAAQQQELLRTWTLEREATVKVLTPSEVARAVRYTVMTQAQGQQALLDLGYDAFDAWVLLSLEQSTALPDQPPFPAEAVGELP